jgi:hypothetical protein
MSPDRSDRLAKVKADLSSDLGPLTLRKMIDADVNELQISVDRAPRRIPS